MTTTKTPARPRTSRVKARTSATATTLTTGPLAYDFDVEDFAAKVAALGADIDALPAEIPGHLDHLGMAAADAVAATQEATFLAERRHRDEEYDRRERALRAGHPITVPAGAATEEMWQCGWCYQTFDRVTPDHEPCSSVPGLLPVTTGKPPTAALGAGYPDATRYVPWNGTSTTVRVSARHAVQGASTLGPLDGEAEAHMAAFEAAHDEETSAAAPGTPGPGPGHTTAEKAPGSAEPPAPAPHAGVDTTSAGPGAPQNRIEDGSGQAKADPLPVGKWDKPGKDGAQS